MQVPFELKDFYNATREAKKVALVDMGFLGDTLHLIPALWEARRHYPQAALHVLTSPVGKAVLELVPELKAEARVVRWPSAAPAPLAERWRAWARLCREPYDVAINFSGADRSLIATALTGARAPTRVTGCGT